MNDSVGLYLNDIGKVPLLNAEEERELAQIIEAGRNAQEELELERQLGSLAVRKADLKAQVAAGEEAKDRFIRANLRLAFSIARRYPLPQNTDLLDLVQEGNLGLEHAVDLFDWRKGYKFSTYATYWIRQSIGRYLDSKTSLIHIPADKSAKLRAAIREANKNGVVESGPRPTTHRKVSNDDVAHLSPEQASLKRLTTPTSLNKSVAEDGSTTLGDLMASTDPTPEEKLMKTVDSEILGQLLGTLDIRSRLAVEMRFGLQDGEHNSFEMIGEALNISGEAARRIVSRAISGLREEADKDPDKYSLDIV